MSFISWILIGLIAGAIARSVVGGGASGWLMNLLLGVLGAAFGGWLIGVLFNVDWKQGFFDLRTWFAALLGSVIVLWIYNAVTGQKANTNTR